MHLTQPVNNIQTLTIANGESASNVLDLISLGISGFRSITILVPGSGWTAADLVIESSVDNTNWYKEYKSDTGNAIVVTGITGTVNQRFMVVDWSSGAMRYLRVRSVDTTTPTTAVNQGAARTLYVVFLH